MIKIFLLFALSISLLFEVKAQIPPQAFNYSAVARNAAGQPIASSTIGIQISILKTSTTGTSVYSENHFVNSDAYGLFNLIVGGGAIQSGSMSTIDWSSDNYYLKVGMDANGGTNFLTMGTTQLLSVPYALHAKTAETLVGGASTDNQQLSVSATGDTLYLQNGGHVIIPGISAANNSGGGGNPLFTSGNGATDIDGNSYSSIIINGQEWMTENLRTTRYANGDSIPNVTDATQWSNLNSGAWAHYNNDSQYENPYGKLYNWFAVSDTRNVCPSGWHVPSDGEWNFLILFLDPSSDTTTNFTGIQSNIVGGKLKTIGSIQNGNGLWQDPNTLATNEITFNGVPAGYRHPNGSFYEIGNYAYWWSSNAYNTSTTWTRYVDAGTSNIYKEANSFEQGFSIRCVKN